MDAQAIWQEFACTGNILRYLDYKQQQQPEQSPARETEHGNLCDTGSCLKGDPL